MIKLVTNTCTGEEKLKHLHDMINIVKTTCNMKIKNKTNNNNKTACIIK